MAKGQRPTGLAWSHDEETAITVCIEHGVAVGDAEAEFRKLLPETIRTSEAIRVKYMRALRRRLKEQRAVGTVHDISHLPRKVQAVVKRRQRYLSGLREMIRLIIQKAPVKSGALFQQYAKRSRPGKDARVAFLQTLRQSGGIKCAGYGKGNLLEVTKRRELDELLGLNDLELSKRIWTRTWSSMWPDVASAPVIPIKESAPDPTTPTKATEPRRAPARLPSVPKLPAVNVETPADPPTSPMDPTHAAVYLTIGLVTSGILSKAAGYDRLLEAVRPLLGIK